MHIPPWLWYSILTLLAWGIVGLLQKLSINYISAESSLIWLVVGFLLLEPFVYPGVAVLHYSTVNLASAIAGGVLNALGGWVLFAALTSGGKASVSRRLPLSTPSLLSCWCPGCSMNPSVCCSGRA